MRIGLRWSIYVRASSADDAHTRPMPRLEDALGHKLQIEHGHTHSHESHPEDYHVLAWSWIEAADFAHGCVDFLERANRLTGGISQRYNFPSKPEDDTWIRFLWTQMPGTALEATLSTVVEFYPIAAEDDAPAKVEDDFSPEIVGASTLTATAWPSSRSDYTIICTLGIRSATKPKLLELHWPNFQQEQLGLDFHLISVKRNGNEGPYFLQVQCALKNVTQVEAITACLKLTDGHVVTLAKDEHTGNVKFSGTQEKIDPTQNAIHSVMLSAAY